MKYQINHYMEGYCCYQVGNDGFNSGIYLKKDGSWGKIVNDKDYHYFSSTEEIVKLINKDKFDLKSKMRSTIHLNFADIEQYIQSTVPDILGVDPNRVKVEAQSSYSHVVGFIITISNEDDSQND